MSRQGAEREFRETPAPGRAGRGAALGVRLCAGAAPPPFPGGVRGGLALGYLR